LLRVLCLAILVAVSIPTHAPRVTTEAPLKPVTVCEILKNHKLYNGKVIAVIGRYAPTEEGSWLFDDKCEVKLETDQIIWPNILWLKYDPSSPPLSTSLEVDMVAVRAKLGELKQQAHDDTAEWAVVYGRLEFPDKLETVVVPTGRRRWAGYGHLGTSPGQIVFRQGDVKNL
jgi:hypothetical protein